MNDIMYLECAGCKIRKFFKGVTKSVNIKRFRYRPFKIVTFLYSI